MKSPILCIINLFMHVDKERMGARHCFGFQLTRKSLKPSFLASWRELMWMNFHYLFKREMKRNK